jgi:anhydro-N-acetylmuramic acid kinase
MARLAKPELYIGLMSGTSVDGVDGVIAEISTSKICLIANHSLPFANQIRLQVLELFSPGANEIDRLGELDKILASYYSQCVEELLANAKLEASAITAIGNHGQTVRHRPCSQNPFTLQIGDASLLATRTTLPVISDFRRADMILGGQGAPLTPGFHQAFFASASESRCVINIGGIANISNLPLGGSVTGWDIGPGNGLMDAWIQLQKGLKFDENGSWAATGKVEGQLLKQLLEQPYFARLPPKSTGKEEFTLAGITPHITGIPPEDVQATLLELTALTIANAIKDTRSRAAYLCGGGAYNTQLKDRLSALCSPTRIQDTQVLGIAPNWVEATAFAWLAHQYWHNLPGNIPSVTGASRPGRLGCLTLPA